MTSTRAKRPTRVTLTALDSLPDPFAYAERQMFDHEISLAADLSRRFLHYFPGRETLTPAEMHGRLERMLAEDAEAASLIERLSMFAELRAFDTRT
jgi:hypothetical protein